MMYVCEQCAVFHLFLLLGAWFCYDDMNRQDMILYSIRIQDEMRLTRAGWFSI